MSGFADDIGIWATGTDWANVETILQSALDKVTEWTARHKMTLSLPKTKFSLFTLNGPEGGEIKKGNVPVSLFLDGEPVEYDPTPKFLGVKFDRQLDLVHHSKMVASKGRQRLGILRRLSGTAWASTRQHCGSCGASTASRASRTA